MTNAINWFDIPVTNMDRAIAFYSAVLGKDLQKTAFGGDSYVFFPADNMGVGGGLVKDEQAVPSDKGTLVYLNGGDDLSAALARVEPAGGTILVPKTLISEENGYFALFLDTEGNRVGFHSIH